MKEKKVEITEKEYKKMKKASKKRRKPVKSILALGVIGAIMYFSPWNLGGSLLGFFGTGFGTGDGTDYNTVEIKREAEEIHLIHMQFKENQLELHGVLYSTIEALQDALPELQRDFNRQKIHVEYLKHKNDPYILAKHAEDLLKNNNFSFSTIMREE